LNDALKAGALAVVLAGVAWFVGRRPVIESGVIDEMDDGDEGAEGEGRQGGGVVEMVGDVVARVKLATMGGIDPTLLQNVNVQAFLSVIRRGEGTSDAMGYRRMFGGGYFDSFADHPRRVNCFELSRGGKLCSSAAGAYQFLRGTWDETAKKLGLRDFSPASQDLAALARIKARGALGDVLAGRFDAAMSRVNREWASMPGSTYGQPTISAATARAQYLAAGGKIEGVA
jgi:muramidase (phage lysozyme)